MRYHSCTSSPLKPISFAVSLSLFITACGSGSEALDSSGIDQDLDLGSALEGSENSEGDVDPQSQPELLETQQPAEQAESASDLQAMFSPDSQTILIIQPAPEPEQPLAPMPEVQPESQPDTLEEPEPVSMPEVDLRNLACDADPQVLGAALLELTNQSRQQSQTCGNRVHEAATPLEWDESLSRAALNHSVDMSTHNFFSHTGSDGSSSFQRAVAEGFPSNSVGENIAAGQRTTGTVQDGWMNSSGHCENIMRSAYTHMGASCVVDEGANFSRYWTVVFGRR